MIKILAFSTIILVALWIAASIASARPDSPHPGKPLGILPAPKSRIKAPRQAVKVWPAHAGKKQSGCNRIAPGSQRCDALQYHSPDWTGYANGTANRDLL